MGGWKQSGIGFRHGEYGIKKYCRPESIVVTRFCGKREPTWYPYTKARHGLVSRVVHGDQRPRPEAPPRQTRLSSSRRPGAGLRYLYTNHQERSRGPAR